MEMKPSFPLNNLKILLFIILLSTPYHSHSSDALSKERVDIINNDTSTTPDNLLTNLTNLLNADVADDIKYLSKKYFNINKNFWHEDNNHGKSIQQLIFDKNSNSQIDKFTPYSIRIYFESNSTRRQLALTIYNENEFIITPDMIIYTFGNPDDKFFIKDIRDINKSTLVYRYNQSYPKKFFPRGVQFTFINQKDDHKIFFRKSFFAGTKYDQKPSNIEFENELNRRLDFNIHKEYRCKSIVLGNIGNPILYGD